MTSKGDSGRVRRPTPLRTTPIRTWEGFLGAPDAAPAPGDAPPDLSDDAIRRSVELGYRVVEEYLTRGQEAAQRIRQGTYGAADAAQDVQGVAEQLVRSASDFAGAWVEFFALAGRDLKRPDAPRAAGRSEEASRVPETSGVPAAAPPAEPPASLRVRLRVETVRYVEAMLDVSPVPADHGLVAHRLRLADGSARIDGIVVTPSPDGAVVISVKVPDDQPAGYYTGRLIDDATNVAVGEISLRVE